MNSLLPLADFILKYGSEKQKLKLGLAMLIILVLVICSEYQKQINKA